MSAAAIIHPGAVIPPKASANGSTHKPTEDGKPKKSAQGGDEEMGDLYNSTLLTAPINTVEVTAHPK